jgi:hypothetical protein
VVHSGAISRLSPPLNVLINGSMQEAQTKVVRWDDIEAEDFTRFCQFAYIGDYSPPEPGEVLSQEPSDTAEETEDAGSPIDQQKTIEEDIPSPPIPPPVDLEAEEELEPADDDWGFPRSSKKKKKGRGVAWPFESEVREHSKISKLRQSFESRIDNNAWASPEDPYKVVANNNPRQDFTPVFLGHARLYLLGDKYGIKNLTSLALYKLLKTLIAFHLYEDRIVDVLRLVRFTYEHAPQQSTDPLRSLVTEYIATEIDIIGKSVHFHALLVEGGEFVAEFWKIIQHQLL